MLERFFFTDTMLKTQDSHTNDAISPDRGRSRVSYSGFPEQVRQIWRGLPSPTQ